MNQLQDVTTTPLWGGTGAPRSMKCPKLGTIIGNVATWTEEQSKSRSRHPTSVILIRKPIRSSNNFRIHQKFWSGEFWDHIKVIFRSGQKLYQEILYQKNSRNHPESPTLNLEWHLIGKIKKQLVSRITVCESVEYFSNGVHSRTNWDGEVVKFFQVRNSIDVWFDVGGMIEYCI